MCSQACPNTQSNKFAISLQYLKEERNDVDFLHVDKHESLIEIDAMILMGLAKYSQSILGSNLQCLYNISKKKLEMKLIFCMQININVLALSFLTEMTRHVQNTKNMQFEMFWQYLVKKISLAYFLHAGEREISYKLM